MTSDALDQTYERARALWPGVEVPRERFVAHIRERLRAAGSDDPALLATGDLYLACACLDGDPRALRAFDGAFAGAIAQSLAGSRTWSTRRSDERSIMAREGIGQPAPRCGPLT